MKEDVELTEERNECAVLDGEHGCCRVVVMCDVLASFTCGVCVTVRSSCAARLGLYNLSLCTPKRRSNSYLTSRARQGSRHTMRRTCWCHERLQSGVYHSRKISRCRSMALSLHARSTSSNSA